MRCDNETHESDAKNEIQSPSKIELLQAEGLGRVSKTTYDSPC